MCAMPNTTLIETDELRHPAGDALNWNDSYYFNFFDPDNKISGVFRIGVLPNQKSSNMWCCLFKEEKIIYNRLRFDLPYPGKGVEAGLSAAGLTVTMTEPFKSFKISLNDRHLKFDVSYVLFSPVFNRSVQKTIAPELGLGHYAQFGEASGTLTVYGQSSNVLGYGIRDHGWGPRSWEGWKYYQLTMAACKRDYAIGFNVSDSDQRGKYVGGFLFDGKKNRDIVKATSRIEYAPDGFTPQKVYQEFEDEDGVRQPLVLTIIASENMPYDFNSIQNCFSEIRMGDRTLHGIFEYNQRLCHPPGSNTLSDQPR